jgi:hypothetical protein
MALHQPTLGQRAASYRDLALVLLIVAAVIVLMIVATALFGVHRTGPSLEIVPDPAHLSGLLF